MKRAIKRFLRMLGRDIVFLTQEQQETLLHSPSSSYRELTIEETLTSPLLKSGELSLKEGRFLSEIIRELPSTNPIIEIGTLFGSSARIILLSKAAETKLICVDAFRWNPLNIPPEIHKRITANILKEAIADSDLELIEMDKNTFYEQYSEAAPSLVFCDAVHTYEETKKDIEWAKKVGAEVICGHDYDTEKFPGVVQAVHEFGEPKKIVETLWLL